MENCEIRTFGGSQSSKMRTKFTILYSKVKNMRTKTASWLTLFVFFAWLCWPSASWTAEAWGRDRNARLTWSRQRKSWLSEPVSFFKIGVDLNGMSASEYLPLYQSFTNRTHIRNGRRFDQSEISQIVEKNICCGVILSDFDTIKKYTSNGIYRVTV